MMPDDEDDVFDTVPPKDDPQSALEQRLINDEEALTLCQWWLAYSSTKSTLEDHDFDGVFEMFWNGANALSDLSPAECANSLKDELKSADGDIDQLLAELKDECDDVWPQDHTR